MPGGAVRRSIEPDAGKRTVRFDEFQAPDRRGHHHRADIEVDDAVEALSSLMEPMIMVVLGTLIGGLVIAMYLPIFKLGGVV